LAYRWLEYREKLRTTDAARAKEEIDGALIATKASYEADIKTMIEKHAATVKAVKEECGKTIEAARGKDTEMPHEETNGNIILCHVGPSLLSARMIQECEGMIERMQLTHQEEIKKLHGDADLKETNWRLQLHYQEKKVRIRNGVEHWLHKGCKSSKK